jgi:large subunit ribosomal protein L6
VKFDISENSIQVKWERDEDRAMAGTMRALISNNVIGVSEGYTKNIKLNGVGYRANVQGKKLTLTLGFSHPVEYVLPDGIEAKSENQTEFNLTSNNKQLLGQICAEIRAYRPPEPYKGKGIFIDNEHVARKERKKAAAAAG